MTELPRVSFGKKWYERDWIVDVIVCIFTFCLAIISAIRLGGDKNIGWLSAGATLFITCAIFAISVLKALRGKKTEERYSPVNEPRDLVAWCAGLLSHFQQLSPAGTDMKAVVRIVLHRVEYEKDARTPAYLEQITSYVGGKGGPAGRRISARSGVIGKSVRTGKPCTLTRQTQDAAAFVDLLVSEWGFYWEEASAISTIRWAFAAVPITARIDGPVIGVVFVDSNDRNFFTESVLNAIFNNTVALTEQIRLLSSFDGRNWR